jgi:hypothetical protein
MHVKTPIVATKRGHLDTAHPLGDPEIRALLKARVFAAKDKTTVRPVLIEELGLLRRRVRVDIAVVGDLIHGYEIKSDRDTLRRLPRQVMVYGEICDRATLVVGARFVEDALEILPSWWGVFAVLSGKSGINRLVRRRASRPNPARSARSLAEFLWMEEALRLLEARGGVRGYRGKPRSVLWDRICDLYTVDEIASEVRLRLKARPRAWI